MRRSNYKKAATLTFLALLNVHSSSFQRSSESDQELHVEAPIKQCVVDYDSNERRKTFRNFHIRCEEWATVGECDSNPSYMISTCAKSCMDLYNASKNASCSSIPKNQCQLYMAESSIPNAGMGMFTSVHIDPLSGIFHPDIVINVIDYKYHNRLHRERQRRLSGEWKELNSEGLSDESVSCYEWATAGECDANPLYMWESCKRSCTELPNIKDLEDKWWLPTSYYWESSNTFSVHDADRADSLIPGIGMLANSHLGLVNVIMNRPSIDSAGLNRTVDPGAGAFSTYHSLSHQAERHIPAGMEIFPDYGDEWFSLRDQYSFVPLLNDYIDADALLHNFTDFVKTKEHTFATELLSFIHKDLISNNRLRSLLPSDVDEAKKAQKQGAAMYSLPNAIRSVEWLEKNAYCLDNIKPQKSSLPQAGRGAFATRSISKGYIVAPAPMLHIQKSNLHMYKDQSSNGIIDHWGEQLLLNYCYGNPRSSLLLFPYSPVTNFINHNFERSKVNTRIQWSKLATHKEEWLELSVEEVLSKQYAGLVMEFIATRDISEGEEIFIDYGNSWEDAWMNHVDNWNPANNAEDHVPVELLNKEDEIMTLEEQKSKPYPQNALLLCILPKDLISNVDQNKTNEVDWYETFYTLNTIEYSEKCSIFERYQSPDTNETLYKAAIPKEVNILVNNLPRRAIQFVDRPYTANQHGDGVFRQEIGIPDAIFPLKWRDLEVNDN